MIKITPTRKKINATIQIPGSKSLTNRALIIGSLAQGISNFSNPLFSDDTRVMITALKQLGIKIKKTTHALEVFGKGGTFSPSSQALFLENAGTSTRFLLALASLHPFATTLTGDLRMEERPMKDLIMALKKLGATTKALKQPYCIPLTVQGPLQGGLTSLQAKISSQFLSALLLAAPYAQKPVSIKIKGQLTSKPYIDLTLQIMKDFGVMVKNNQYRFFQIKKGIYKSRSYHIEGDASSATYPFALAALHQGKMTITNLSIHSRQGDLKFLDVLKKMGCQLKRNSQKITVIGPAELKALGSIDLNDLPDAAMTVAILCAFARGISILKNLGNLRVKETDRLQALANELKKIGVKVQAGQDYLKIWGNPQKLHGATIETYNDHRMAMCFAVVGSKISDVFIKNPECVSKTYPSFWKDLKNWGGNWKRIVNKEKKVSASSNLPNNLILGGLRGTGKSTLGKIIAQLIHYDFIDTDELIEKQTGLKILKLVQKKGWPYFRKLEHQICKELQNRSKTVIATGGGIFTNPKNHQLLKNTGFVIILTCDATTSVQRIKKSYQRPSLTKEKNALAEIQQLWKEREKEYKKVADIFFDTSTESDNLKADTVQKAKKILRLLQNPNHALSWTNSKTNPLSKKIFK